MSNTNYLSANRANRWWQPSKRFLHVTLTLSLLLSSITTAYAQAPEGESETVYANHVYLPMISEGTASDTASDTTSDTGSNSETVDEYAFVLDAPEPATVQAAAVDAVLTVTKVADTNDGICNSDCSLREAVHAANTTPATFDVIAIPAGTYVLTQGTLTLFNVSLTGSGPSTTIVEVAPNLVNSTMVKIPMVDLLPVSTEIKQITLRNADKGIIHNGGKLMVHNSRIENISDYAITSNGNDMDTEGIFIHNSIIEGIEISNMSGEMTNSVARKSNKGLSLLSSKFTISGSTVMSNSQGIDIVSSDVKIQNSAIIQNNGEGGISLSFAHVELVNTTISNNKSYEKGGGIYVLYGSAKLDSVTIVQNTSLSTSPLAAGGVFAAESQLIMKRSILAQNEKQNGQSTMNLDCAGSIESLGFNLIGTSTACTIMSQSSDKIGVDPLLGGLSLNGATTKNHKPNENSPVVDVIGLRNGCVPIDQRYVARPRDGNGDGINGCDIGAVER